MIGEAIDTVITLGWALAAWIVLLALAAVLAVHAVVAVAWWVGRAVCALIRRACAYAAVYAPHRPPGDSSVTGTPPGPSQPPSRPAWARTDEQDAA